MAGVPVGDAADPVGVGAEGALREVVREGEAPAAPTDQGARVQTIALVVIATVAAVALLYVGRDVFVPVALGATLAAVLRPLVRWMGQRLRLPAPAGAAVVIFGLVGTLFLAGNALQDPAHDWVNNAPRALAQARIRLDQVRRPLQRVTRAVENATGPVPSAASARASGGGVPGVPPSAMGDLMGKAFGTTAGILASTAEVLLLAYFLLAGNDRFLRRVVGGLRDAEAKRAAVLVVRESEGHVGRYLSTMAFINLAQGTVIALAMWAIGVPAPLLWGVAAFACEFLPYLGAAVMVGGLAITGLATFDSIGHALAPPALYLLVSTLQTSVVSPLAYGRTLRLNPVAILVTVLAGYALWGVAGVFLAVPAAAAVNVLAEHVPALAPVGAFLRE